MAETTEDVVMKEEEDTDIKADEIVFSLRIQIIICTVK